MAPKTQKSLCAAASVKQYCAIHCAFNRGLNLKHARNATKQPACPTSDDQQQWTNCHSDTTYTWTCRHGPAWFFQGGALFPVKSWRPF